jgi:hypothetical protein
VKKTDVCGLINPDTEVLRFFRNIGNIPGKSNIVTKCRLYCLLGTKFYDVMMA